MRRTPPLFAASILAAATGCSPGGTTSEAPWTLMRSDANSATAIVVYFHGSCDSLRSVHTISTATTVTFQIRIYEESGVCDDAGRSTAIRVRLGAELGSRTVIGRCHQDDGVLCVSADELRVAGLNLRDLPVNGP